MMAFRRSDNIAESLVVLCLQKLRNLRIACKASMPRSGVALLPGQSIGFRPVAPKGSATFGKSAANLGTSSINFQK